MGWTQTPKLAAAAAAAAAAVQRRRAEASEAAKLVSRNHLGEFIKICSWEEGGRGYGRG